MDAIQNVKLPNKGETVLVFDQTKTNEAFEAYRLRVLEAGGRLRRATNIKSLQRHLAVYSPTFIVLLRDDAQ